MCLLRRFCCTIVTTAWGRPPPAPHRRSSPLVAPRQSRRSSQRATVGGNVPVQGLPPRTSRWQCGSGVTLMPAMSRAAPRAPSGASTKSSIAEAEFTPLIPVKWVSEPSVCLCAWCAFQPGLPGPVRPLQRGDAGPGGDGATLPGWRARGHVARPPRREDQAVPATLPGLLHLHELVSAALARGLLGRRRLPGRVGAQGQRRGVIGPLSSSLEMQRHGIFNLP